MSTLLERVVATSGLSQSEVARRAGMKPSQVNAYVRGRQSPSAETLERIALAAGVEVRLERVRRRSGDLVRERREDLLTVVRRHGFEHLYVFGSVARGDDTPDSDVDLLLDPRESGWTRSLLGSPVFEVQEKLSRVLGVSVDLELLDDRTPRHVLDEMVHL